MCVCVCCSQMETPVSSPYPQQRKKASHRQRLFRKYPIYISPYNRATPSPGSPIFSYTTNSSSREVCEPRWSYDLGQRLNLLFFKCSFYFQQCLKELNNLLRRHTQPREGDKDEPLVKRPRWGGTLSLHQQLRDVQNDRLAAAQKWACVKKPKLQSSGQRCRVMPELWLTLFLQVFSNQRYSLELAHIQLTIYSSKFCSLYLKQLFYCLYLNVYYCIAKIMMISLNDLNHMPVKNWGSCCWI